MNKIVVVGARGQLGTEITKIIESGKSELGELPAYYQTAELISLGSKDLDITKAEDVFPYFEITRPAVVVNCAAMTDVNGCESNPEKAMRVNAIGARNLAMACKRIGAKLVHVSTDYVFDGNGSRPYVEWDVCSPQSVYGSSKLLGESYVRDFCKKYFIVRTSWLYGYYGKNFVKTIAKAAMERGKVSVVDDQRGNPTNAADLAYHIAKLIPTQEYGVYHCTGKGECSWYEFASQIIKNYNIDAEVLPCSTEEYPTPAKRPAYSSLRNLMLELTVGDEMRPWEEALKCFCENCSIEK